jgi:O-antigen/teichoic acid export membrane protein
MVLFGIMGLGILAVGVAIAEPLLHALEIPAGREQAAAVAFYVTIAQLVVITVGTPYRGALEAHQAMGQVAADETSRSLLSLLAAATLLVLPGDPLIVYSLALFVGTCVRFFANASVATTRFPVLRVRPSRIRWTELRRLASFTGWTTLIRIGPPLHAQAGVVLIGMAFSPVVTSAYGIAMRLRGYHSHFTKAIPRAAQPAMTTKEARGERGYVHDLALMTSKYGVLGVLFMVVPLVLETDALLRLWLAEVPPGTAAFVQVTMLWMTVQVLENGIERAIFAQGTVQGYGLLTLSLWLLSLGACALALFGLGAGPMALPWIFFGATCAHLAVTVGVGARLIGLSAGRWWRETVVPGLAPTLPAAALAFAVHAALPEGFVRLVAVTAAYGVAALPFAWWWSIGPKEKRALAHGAAAFGRRARRKERVARADTPPLR